MTVLDLIKKYLSQKTGVRHNTEANHNFVLNIIKKEDFGRQRIDRVKLSDAKCWLIKLQQDGRGYSSIYIEDTKTSSGTREIPMMDDVYQCFQRIIANRSKPKAEPMLVGRCDFLYLGKDGKPMVALHWEHYFKHICQKYNSIYQVQMPKVTPHVCRHTFSSNMAKSGMNPKTLQYLMVHSDIGVTLNTYTQLGFEDAQAELERAASGE